MAEALILEFRGSTPAQYTAVNTILGIDPTTGQGDWPAGLLHHVGTAGDGGDVMVFEVWDSRESQGAFMASRLGPALGQGRAARPVQSRVAIGLGPTPHRLTGCQGETRAIQRGSDLRRP